MRFSDLKGRAVVDIGDSKKIGEFSDILIDPTTRKPVGIKIKTGGLFSQPITVPVERLRSVGADAVTVVRAQAASARVQQPAAQPQPAQVPVEEQASVSANDSADATQPVDPTAPVEPVEAAKLVSPPPAQEEPDPAVPPLNEPVEATKIIGDKVITDTGTFIGEVQDLLIDPVTLAITGYEVKAGGLFARPKEIDITPDVRHGDNLITVPATLIS